LADSSLQMHAGSGRVGREVEAITPPRQSEVSGHSMPDLHLCAPEIGTGRISEPLGSDRGAQEESKQAVPLLRSYGGSQPGACHPPVAARGTTYSGPSGRVQR
jgi:hypothetical protein